jgi:hypothetical protein
MGVDGHFLRHFNLTMRAVEGAVLLAATDREIEAWFLQQTGVTSLSIQKWNEIAPKIGSRGHPGYYTRHVAKWFLHPKSVFDPVDSMFEAIIQDERLDKAEPGATDDPDDAQ